ncbi:MAG: hypothetical protein ACOYKA_01020 [Legionellaceae bacterium]
MPYLPSARQVITRMTQEDRQSINRMIQHKRDEFENVIKKGIISMLNAHVERKKIAEERKKYLSVLTRKNHQKKEQMNSLAEATKLATSSAPMGIGVASHVAIAAASGVGSAAMDNAENRRQEIEAQEQFHSAQMLYYITDKDFEDIAQSVASTLGYRFQFLLFRLAAGENGYMKFAEFLVASIKTHAIQRLREHKSEVVKALINAAIPPSTDAISYRDWPQINISKFKLQHRFALHKTLELDDEANDIISRCGPAVRALLGAYRSHVDSATGKIKYYESYTMIGALNHAPILNSEAGVFMGLETPHRKRELLDGTMKYPMILLAVGETTADLGVNFATKATGQFLEDAHVVALLRIVPTFFSHQMNKALPRINNADLRYPDERLECPWTHTREQAWQERLECLYKIDASAIQEEDVVSTKENILFKAMELASNTFDAQEAKKNLLSVINRALLSEIQANATNVKTSERSKKQIEAVIASKYAALATSDLMTCIVQCNAIDESYFDLAVEGIEASNSAFNAARSLPLHETNKYYQVVDASNKAIQCAEIIFELHDLYRENFQVVLTTLQQSNELIATKNWANKEILIQNNKIKAFKIQIAKEEQEAARLMNLSRMMSEYLQRGSDTLPQTTALEAFYVAADKVRIAFDVIEPPIDIAKAIQIIQRHVLETELNREHIKLTLSLGYCEGVEDLLAAANLAYTEALAALQNTYRLNNTIGIWQLNMGLSSNTEALLLSYIENATRARNTSTSIIRGIRYRYPNEPLSDITSEVNIFLAREQANTEQGLLRFIASQHSEERIKRTEKSIVKTAAATQIEEALVQFDVSVQQLNFAIKVDRAREASMAHSHVTQTVSEASLMTLFHALEKQLRKTQQARLKVEQATTHNFEITDFSKNKAQWAVTEGERAEKEMKKMKEELVTLQKYCLLEEDAIDNLSFSDSKSESTSTSTDVKQLADLESLFNLISSISTRSSSQPLFDPKDPIINALYQLIQNGARISRLINLSEEAITDKILTSIKFLKHEISQGAKGLSAHWDTWLITHLAKWMMDTIQDMEKGVSYQLDEARKELHRIKKIANDESSALKIAREAALESIKKAYMDIGIARERQREIERNPHAIERTKWTLVHSTLAWSARLTDLEYKWLEGQRSAKYVETVSVDYKSSIIRAHLFLLVYARHLLEEKKEEIRRLNMVSFLLKQCQKQLYDLGQADEKNDMKRLSGLEKKHEKLDQLLRKKLELAEHEKNDIEYLRTSILSQAPRIYFNEWKKKTYNPNTQDIRTMALKAAIKERESSVMSPVHLGNHSDEKRAIAAEEKSIDIDSREDISHKKQNAKHTLPEKVLKCKDDAENNTIDDIEVMAETLKNHLLTMLSTHVSAKPNDAHERLSHDFHRRGAMSSQLPRSPVMRGELSAFALFAQAEPNASVSAPQATSSGLLVQML